MLTHKETPRYRWRSFMFEVSPSTRLRVETKALIERDGRAILDDEALRLIEELRGKLKK